MDQVPFDPGRLRLDWSKVPDCQVPAQRVELASVRSRTGRRFIPSVPMAWFDRACVLPGKALAVWMVLWFLAKVKKTTTFVLTQAALNQHRITRWEKYAALEALGAAGLISVCRRGRKSPEVTLLDPPAEPG